jgi:hypothetical protein
MRKYISRRLLKFRIASPHCIVRAPSRARLEVYYKQGARHILGGEGGRKYTQSCYRNPWGVRDDLPTVDASRYKTQSHRAVEKLRFLSQYDLR